MENASKALLMAAGMLVALMILSLAVYLFVEFGSTSAEYYEQIKEQDIVKFNKDYTVFEGRTNITIYEIVSLALQTQEYNTNNSTNIKVYVESEDFTNLAIEEIQTRISDLNVDKLSNAVKTYEVYKIEYNDRKVNKISFVEYN
jgi:hypothetical protein